MAFLHFKYDTAIDDGSILLIFNECGRQLVVIFWVLKDVGGDWSRIDFLTAVEMIEKVLEGRRADTSVGTERAALEGVKTGVSGGSESLWNNLANVVLETMTKGERLLDDVAEEYSRSIFTSS